MKNFSPWRYPGSKNKLLKDLEFYLDPLIEKNKSFSDAFVGGGSVSLHFAEKYPEASIHINDFDDWIYSFWDVVVFGGADLDNLLSRLELNPTIDLFYELSELHPLTRTDKAYRAMFFNRCCFSGIVKRDGNKVKSSPIGGRKQTSKYTVDCRYNAEKLISKTLDCHKLLKNRTKVYNQDVNTYLDLNIGAALYLDPPYREKGPQLYNFFMDDNQHKMLANKLQSKDDWVLSYDDDLVIKGFYSNNKITDLAARYSINGKKNIWKDKNELIITK